MISFMISVVPPKTGQTRLNRQSQPYAGEHWTSAPRVKAGQHLVSGSHGVQAAQAGPRSPARESSRHAATPRAAGWPRPPRRTSGRGYPSHRCGRRLTGELIAAQLPQVLAMHDPGHGSQVRPRSREPSRGNQDLGRGQHAHHQHEHGRHPMTTAAAGPSPTRRQPGWEPEWLPTAIVA
jgi:hypothetical protein